MKQIASIGCRHDAIDTCRTKKPNQFDPANYPSGRQNAAQSADVNRETASTTTTQVTHRSSTPSQSASVTYGRSRSRSSTTTSSAPSPDPHPNEEHALHVYLQAIERSSSLPSLPSLTTRTSLSGSKNRRALRKPIKPASMLHLRRRCMHHKLLRQLHRLVSRRRPLA